MDNEETSADIAKIAGKVLAGAVYTDADVRSLAASCLTQAPDKVPGAERGLPVAGYKSTQPTGAIAAVNVFKELEERTLRHIEALSGERTYSNGDFSVDPRLLAVGRTQLQGAFMFLARAVFQPGRVELPEDAMQQAQTQSLKNFSGQPDPQRA